MKTVRELKERRAALISQARALLETADTEKRDLTSDETAKYDEMDHEIDALAKDIERRGKLESREAELNEPDARRNSAAPQFNLNLKTKRGDSELQATAHYIRTGDEGALSNAAQHGDEFTFDLNAASNDTEMNVGTAADGGVLVPTGHYQGIIAKRNEDALFGPLGVMPIPGIGTTVNVPIETGSANVFVSTDEYTSDNDRDAPVLDKAAMTLVDFTKDVELTYDLLNDEDSALMAFIDNYVGRALAKTHNSALVTEALANGTSTTLGAAAAATAGDVEVVEYALQAEYADRAAWVMRRATEGSYRKLISTGPFLYQATPQGQRRQLGDFPVFNSSYVPAIGAGNKSSIFGDFEYVGMREGGLTFLRNPFLLAKKRKVVLHYYTRIVYKVLNPDAILYGKHPTS